MGSEELFPQSTLPTARNIDLQDIYLSSKNIIKSTNDATFDSRRLSRRYQPYNKSLNNKKNATSTTTTTTTTFANNLTTEESLNTEPLFGPIISSSSNYQFSIQQQQEPSIILDDEEVFEEFDNFIHSPTRFLSSPPPSPTLSPFENNDDIDFNDFPLFP